MERLKSLRSEKGLSQARLAARAGLDPSTVNQIERGAREASPPTLRRLADALGVSIAVLLEDKAPKAQAPSPGATVTVGSSRTALWNVEALQVLEDVRDGEITPEEGLEKVTQILVGSPT